MATISLCMIVKNEEKVLERCLESIYDAVDEIIIADTGSTDSTKNIALKYTPLVFDFEWIDDFSAARNFSFSKATKDFVMWLDADDIITKESKEKLIQLKKSLDGTNAVMMKYNTAFDENDNPTFSYYRERIINRAIHPVWRGRVHETIEYSGVTTYSDIEINHKSIKKRYSTRNLDIYEKQLSDGIKMTARDTFYYGRELYYHKKFDRAINILNNFLNDNAGWSENKIEACKILSFCYLETGDNPKALHTLFGSFTYDNPRAEICCIIGSIFIKLNQYPKAIYWFELALTLKPKDANGAFIDINAYGYLPCIQLCVCYDKLGEYKKAEEYNLKAGLYRPDAKAYMHNLNYFKELHAKGVL